MRRLTGRAALPDEVGDLQETPICIVKIDCANDRFSGPTAQLPTFRFPPDLPVRSKNVKRTGDRRLI